MERHRRPHPWILPVVAIAAAVSVDAFAGAPSAGGFLAVAVVVAVLAVQRAFWSSVRDASRRRDHGRLATALEQLREYIANEPAGGGR